MKKDCNNCFYSGRPSYKYPCCNCVSACDRPPDKWEAKPMTNADRIRAMSDDELVDFICSVYDDDDTFGKFIEGYVIPCYNEDSIKEWLQKPAED